MVSNVGNNTGQNAVADILKQQQVKVEKQREQRIDEGQRQEQIKQQALEQQQQNQTNADDRRGQQVNISV